MLLNTNQPTCSSMCVCVCDSVLCQWNIVDPLEFSHCSTASALVSTVYFLCPKGLRYRFTHKRSLLEKNKERISLMFCSFLLLFLATCLNWRDSMASGINIYSQLLISLIQIVDISNSNCWYQQLNTDISNASQFQLLISTIRISDISNSNCWYH